MKTIDKDTQKAVRSLIIINNDRVQGYKDAAEHAEDSDLKTLFSQYSQQSQQFRMELEKFLDDMQDAPDTDDTKVSGKVFRGWMGIKDNVAPNNRKAVLSSCEFGEDAAKRNYEDVLKDYKETGDEVYAVINRQFSEIKKAHDKIKAMRDSEKDAK
jgi:uncharacterized protein (TIGR02284 family)